MSLEEWATMPAKREIKTCRRCGSNENVEVRIWCHYCGTVDMCDICNSYHHAEMDGELD